VAEEDSVACRSHQTLVDPNDKRARSIYLSSIFLADRTRVDRDRPSLAYGLTLGVRVPDYEVERKFWTDGHYEGGYLFRDTMIVEITRPQQADADWTVAFDWQSKNLGRASQSLSYKTLMNGKIQMWVPFGSDSAPGISGKLRFVVSTWND